MERVRSRRRAAAAAAAVAVAALAIALMPSRNGCPFPGAEAQLLSGLFGFAASLLTAITSSVASLLGLVGSKVTTCTGTVNDVTNYLTNPVQCSGLLCLNVKTYADSHASLGVINLNARVKLWSPKVPSGTPGQDYDPRGKDWASVVSVCRALFQYEKRFASFFIRSSFHDSQSVDVTKCGGADASLFLTIEELARPENVDDNFALITARAAKKIASFFDISVADTVAVCAAVAPEVLSNGRLRILDGTNANLRVGRVDSTRPSPPGNLPSASAGTAAFLNFWAERGFTPREAAALMGSHCLVDSQGCFKGPERSDFCDPDTQDCSNVRMFRWENHYYKDICSATLKVREVPADEVRMAETRIVGMTEPEIDAEDKLETCKFTSQAGRAAARNVLKKQRAGKMAEEVVPDEPVEVTWSNADCKQGAAASGLPATSVNCPHSSFWWYTNNDAYTGLVCQGPVTTSAPVNQLRDATRNFAADQSAWDRDYRAAYLKMVSVFAKWAPKADGADIWGRSKAVFISGSECPGGQQLEASCAQATAGPATADTRSLYSTCTWCNDETCGASTCSACVRDCYKSSGFLGLTRTACSIAAPERCCGCATRVRPMRFNTTSGQVVDTQVVLRYADVSPTPQPDPGMPTGDPGPVPEEAPTRDPGNDAVATPVTVGGATTLANPPASPYTNGASVCSGGSDVRVRGFPASPFTWTPFTRDFVKSSLVTPAASYNKPGTDRTIDAYEIDIDIMTKDLGCPGPLTTLLAYNGSIPGPMFRVTKGRQTLVRFNNKLTAAKIAGTRFSTYPPCDANGRQGRPISVHLHGEASLAPYDGWAEDETCGGESKDYYYANRRPGFGWYHDHALDITSHNAYLGLAGMYVVTDSAKDGGCGEPWNLDELPDTPMIFKDLVFDSGCQLLYDREGPHKNNLYGDVNTVNGVQWPVWKPEARWQRLRWLNSATTRPWKLRIVDDTGADVSGSVCQVIAGDGGIRRNPTAFPRAGLFMGVAERYEVVCDFTAYAGKTLYLWNAQDDYRMKDVPFFCHSHLVMRIEPQAVTPPPNSAFLPLEPARPALDAVLKDADFAAAKAMVANKQCTRTFKFGRRRGHWVINGESWHTARVAASDVGQNTWELWCLETGGGWFHPIHIHLVDFYVLARNWDESQVYDYERLTPKDVVQLNPSSDVALLTRFGPHRGEYMFHCHNLVHEDTEMMRSYNVGPTNTGRTASTALAMQGNPQVITSMNVVYDLYKDPVYPPALWKPTASLTSLKSAGATATQDALKFPINAGLYRIFYPGSADNENAALSDPTVNPWITKICKPQPPAV
ncbi:hypothetical protein HYH03_010165 [Edaphochlamys debaryana]|uniref:Plant heme peroxidase family profile domain-containing protein n=1 Tax=Edaphochlamys debaryana TaxID=47281 RepID=A0A835Y2Y6_9CHLO|nr:hypothetical protein HYH03_010165 [Edaphochlamys debaryana]|eukprot:KAG2491600.1 hypothetical protein HYH03_010165 [Edaphochlamys debaryana]